MEAIKKLFRERPVAAWTGVIGAFLVVIWALFNRAQPQTINSSVAPGPSPDAVLAASLEGRRIDAEMNALNASLAHDAYAIESATLAKAYETSVAAELTKIGFAMDERNVQLQYNIAELGIASSERLDLANIAANLELVSTEAALRTNEIAAERDIILAREAASAATTALLVNSQTSLANISYQRDVELASIGATTEMYRINAGAALGARELITNAGLQSQAIRANQHTANTQAITSVFNTFLGAFGGSFGGKK